MDRDNHQHTLVVRNTNIGMRTHMESSAEMPESLHIPTQVHFHAQFLILVYTLMCASIYTITVVIGEHSQLIAQVCLANIS